MMEMEINKIKDFILKDKFLLAFLVLDLISFILGIFVSLIGTIFFFLIFITATYLIVLFEKHALKIFIVGIILTILSYFMFNVSFSNYSTLLFNLSLSLITMLLFILPQSFLLLILKHIKTFEKQNAIVKTLIIDAIILIPFLMLFGFSIPSL